MPPALDRKLVGNFHFNDIAKPFALDVAEGPTVLEFGLTGRTSGPNGQRYFVVHRLELDVQKGKQYYIEVETKTVDGIQVMSPKAVEKG